MEININDIPLQHRDIAEFLGVEMYVNFCEVFGGDNVYIPTKKTLVNSIRNKEINELQEIEVEMDIHKFNIELLNGYEMSPGELMCIDFMIEE